MNDRTVRIVELPAMVVASFLGFGPEPEALAWRKLTAWAEQRGLRMQPSVHRVFGFNNPNPSPDSPDYGYELWITVDPAMESTEEAKITEFSGGLYAVCRCEVHGDASEVIPATWYELVQWCEERSYGMAHHQWLEEHVAIESLAEGNFVLDLYLPIDG